MDEENKSLKEIKIVVSQRDPNHLTPIERIAETNAMDENPNQIELIVAGNRIIQPANRQSSNNFQNIDVQSQISRARAQSFKNPNLDQMNIQNAPIENIHDASFDLESMKEYKQANFSFAWTDILYQIQVVDSSTGKTKMRALIDKNTGYIRSGELMAIMGPSGCGKTSLMNFLTNNIGFAAGSEHSGEVFINSEKVSFTKISEISSYVMQDDVLFDVLSPKETFIFIAKLRSKRANAEYSSMADELIEDLKLTKCRDTIIGNANRKGLSGGEKKRVSIGVEIISNPTIMFLDEPTSGLDSQTSFIIIDYLRNLAETKNKAIIFTIHQPSSNIVSLFDKIFLLNKGQPVYFGPTEKIVDYFTEVGHPLHVQSNPADAFMHKLEELNSKNVDDLMEEYKKRIKPQVEADVREIISDNTLRLNIPKKNAQTAGFIAACKELLKRALLNIVRNPGILRMRIIITLVYAFVCCSIFSFLTYDILGIANRAGFFFFFTVNIFMTTVFQALLTFPMERGVFLREQASKLYTVLPYYLSKNAVETPFVLFLVMIYCIIVYYIVGLFGPVTNYFMFQLIFIVLAWVSQSFGFLFGASFENFNTALVMTQFSLLPFFLFSGFLINQANMPIWLAWIRFFSPFRYILEAAMRNECDGNPAYTSASNLVNQFNLDIGLANCLLIMVLYGLGLRIIGYFLLKIMVRKLG